MTMDIFETAFGTVIEGATFVYVMHKLLSRPQQKKMPLIIFFILWSVSNVLVNVNISGYAPFINFSIAIFALTYLLNQPFFKVFFTFMMFTLSILLIQMPLIPIYHLFGDTFLGLVVVLILALMICALLLRRYGDWMRLQIEKYENKHFNYLAINLLIFSLIFKIIYDFDEKILTDNYVFFAFMMVLMLGTHYFIYKEIAHISERNKLLEVQDQFRLPLEQAIESIKTKQHEYKNHMTSILGLLKTNTPEDATWQIQGFLNDIKSFDSIEDEIISVDRDVVKAIIYMKHTEAESRNIIFDFSCEGALKNAKILDYELSVVLNNLINNAFEAVMDLPEAKVALEMGFDERSGKYFFQIKNAAPSLELASLSTFGERGFSTKGDGRGYGLYNVRRIVKKYSGNLDVFYENKEIRIKVLFT